MKTCRECGIEKPLDQYYKHKAMADGHLNKCIECVKSRVKKYSLENVDRIREYSAKKAKLPKYVAARKEYAKSEAGKLAHKRALQAYRERYPIKAAAHGIVQYAIREGRITKQEICSECGSTKKIEAHHDDYSKPLDIRWLCEDCHKEWHRHNKPKF
jgi:ribosomal protein S27AE